MIHVAVYRLIKDTQLPLRSRHGPSHFWSFDKDHDSTCVVSWILLRTSEQLACHFRRLMCSSSIGKTWIMHVGVLNSWETAPSLLTVRRQNFLQLLCSKAAKPQVNTGSCCRLQLNPLTRTWAGKLNVCCTCKSNMDPSTLGPLWVCLNGRTSRRRCVVSSCVCP